MGEGPMLASAVMEQLVAWHPEWVIELRSRDDGMCIGLIVSVEQPGKPKWGTAVGVSDGLLSQARYPSAVVDHTARQICQYGHDGWHPVHEGERDAG